MRPNQDLIDDFHNGKCTAAEAKRVMDWLMEEEKAASSKDWDTAAAAGDYPKDYPADMLAAIRAQTFGRPGWPVDQQGEIAPGTETGAGKNTLVRRMPWRRMAVAASILLVAGIALLKYQPRQGPHAGPVIQGPAMAARAAVAPKAPWKVFQAPSGVSAAPSTLQLADGSAVILSPGAVLRYDAASFNKSDRTLYLEGQGRFTVAPDKARPFSVIAGGFTTTALGTSFMVTTKAADLIRVRLYSGKVVVRKILPAAMPVNELYLQPGEEWAYDRNLHQPVVNRFEPLPQKEFFARLPRRDIRKSGDTLIFDNASLTDVLALLQRRYGVRIHADRKLLADAYFTGQVLPGDAIELILRTVTRMNNLTLIAAADDTFTIQ